MIKIEELTESKVENNLRKYLLKRGWSIEKPEKKKGEHGCDVVAWHDKWRKRLFVEAKGSGKAALQMKHNGFYMLFGQILSRMGIEGNNPKKGRIYAIAIPANWENTFKNKIKKMIYGWKLLKLKVFLVSEKEVKEKSYSYFLKKN
ncbi:MAG: hypothetical protein WC619_04685 [Patescibacteria group bacterium]